MSAQKKSGGRAKHPHDSTRPERQSVQNALASGDISALKTALTVRQRHFAEEYVVDYNATAAAIRAGYSTRHADKQAHILTKHAGIAAYIDHLSQSKEAKIVSIDPDYLVQRVHEIVMKEDAKDSDKLRALELLMKHKGMFVDKTEISGPDGGAIEMEQRQRQEEDQAAVVTTLRNMRKRPDLKVVND